MSIFRKILPFEYNFFELFNQHAVLLVRSAEEFEKLVHSSDYALHADRIKALELEADRLVYQCGELLHKTFITPFEREEILKLISTLDDILDLIDAAADCIVIYKIGAMKQSARDLSHLLLQGVKAVQAALLHLQMMKQTEEIRERCWEIHRIESETDLIFRTSLGELFDLENDPKTIIKWKEIFENLEEAADRCEDVADLVQGIVLEFD